VAAQQVTMQLREQIENGQLKAFLDTNDIVDIRIAPEGGAVDNSINGAEDPTKTSRGFGSATVRNTSLTIISVLAASAVALVVYKKSTQREQDPVAESEVESSCGNSTTSGETGDQSGVHTDKIALSTEEGAEKEPASR